MSDYRGLAEEVICYGSLNAYTYSCPLFVKDACKIPLMLTRKSENFKIDTIVTMHKNTRLL